MFLYFAGRKTEKVGKKRCFGSEFQRRQEAATSDPLATPSFLPHTISSNDFEPDEEKRIKSL